jgi:hypothetical protein
MLPVMIRPLSHRSAAPLLGLVLLAAWVPAVARPVDHAFHRHVELLDEHLRAEQQWVSGRYHEALELADGIFEAANDVDRLLEVRQQLSEWDPGGEEALPPAPDAGRVPTLAAYHGRLQQRWSSFRKQNRIAHALYHRVYRDVLTREMEADTTALDRRQQIQEILAELPDLSAHRIRQEALLARLQPMVRRRGGWQDAEWPDGLDIAFEPEGIRLFVRHDHDLGMVKIRSRQPMGPGQQAHLVVRGCRSVELIDPTETDLAIYAMIHDNHEQLRLRIEQSGDFIRFNDLDRQRPLFLKEFRRLKEDSVSDDLRDHRTRFGVRTWYPAITLSRGEPAYIQHWGME